MCFLWGWIRVGTGIEATSTRAEPIRLGMGWTGRRVESLLDSTSTYCGELLGVVHVVAPARPYLHVSFASVIPHCLQCFPVKAFGSASPRHIRTSCFTLSPAFYCDIFSCYFVTLLPLRISNSEAHFQFSSLVLFEILCLLLKRQWMCWICPS